MSQSRKTAAILRSFAAAVLMLFVVTHSLCVFHCATGGGSQSSASTNLPCGGDCGGKDASTPCSPSDSPSCATLKTLFSNGALFALDAPDFHVISALIPAGFFSDAIGQERAGRAPFRQTAWENRVLTPEVYLGPALRSNAPPFQI